MTKAIIYSHEHIHMLDDGTEKCYLGRNWNRCTAEACTDPSSEQDAVIGETGYYDGSQWLFFTGLITDDGRNIEYDFQPRDGNGQLVNADGVLVA